MRTSLGRLNCAALVACSLLAGVAAPSAALAAGEMWLKVPNCEGEATDDQHKKEIDLLSFSQSVTRAIDPKTGRPANSETSCDPLTVIKKIDKASPTLMVFALRGQNLNEVVLAARKHDEDTIDFLKIKLRNAVIVSVAHSEFSKEAPLESVSMTYDEISVEYTPQGSDGKPQGAVLFRWDCRRAKQL